MFGWILILVFFTRNQRSKTIVTGRNNFLEKHFIFELETRTKKQIEGIVS
jgi:hypothetical protein